MNKLFTLLGLCKVALTLPTFFLGGGEVVFVFEDRVSPCSSDCLGMHSVDEAGLELRDL